MNEDLEGKTYGSNFQEVKIDYHYTSPFQKFLALGLLLFLQAQFLE